MFRTVKTSTYIFKLSKYCVTYKQIHNVSFRYNSNLKCPLLKKYFINCIRTISEKTVPDLGDNTQLKVSDDAIEFQNSNYVENISEITGGDAKLEKKLQMLMLEAEVYRQEGEKAPSAEFIKEHHWKELLLLPSKSARKKYYAFLWKVEKIRANAKLKRKNASKKRDEIKEEVPDDDHIKYGFQGNTIFIRIYDTTINQQTNNKLVQAMRFGQKLIVDCSYDGYMTNQEKVNTAKQLMLLFAENRAHDDPFDLHYCNADMNGKVMHALYKHIPTLKEPWFPLHVHEKSYLDLFPKDKLVYLTPHCREDLYEFDHDAIYIIGAMVDKTNSEPLSLAKAKKEGLKMARLPLDRYLQWGSGSGKSLTINQMTSILLDIKSTGDWSYALKHVPRRKIVETDEYTRDDFRTNFDKRRNDYERGFKQKTYAGRIRDNTNSSTLHGWRDSNRINIKDIMK